MTEKTNRKKRSRSPSYPIFDLRTAVEKAQFFYKSEGFNKVAADIAPMSWGLTEGSSAGYRYISALIQYGLFEDEGSGDERKVFLSELGKTIVVDERENSKERKTALKEAATNPQVYNELLDIWGTDIPSNATIKYHLIKDFKFNQKKVEKFIDNFRSTLEFVDLSEDQQNDISESSNEVEEISNNPTHDKSDKSIEKKNEGEEGILDIAIPLISGKQATLKIPRPLSEEDFELVKKLIISYLDISKPAITSNKKKDVFANLFTTGEKEGTERSH